MTFAEKTTVSPEKSRFEIESLLRKYGATDFVSGTNDSTGFAMIGFRCKDRILRFELRIPQPDEKRFTHHPKWTWQKRTAIEAAKLCDQENRRMWRALALVIKAKLEAVQSGITTFEHEFLAHIVMPDGKTVGQHVAPGIAEAYQTGRVPLLLVAGGGEGAGRG